MTFSLNLSEIDQWQVVDITNILKTHNDFSLFKMSDKAALNLLNPVYIHEYIQYGYYANAVAMLMIFPLMISYIEFSESHTFELLAHKLQELYLNDLDSQGAV